MAQQQPPPVSSLEEGDKSSSDRSTEEPQQEDKKQPKSAPPSLGSPSLSSVSLNSTVPPASPPRSPRIKSTPSSPSSDCHSPRLKHPSVTNTPQMMMLGKDGSDYRDLMLSSSRSREQRERKQALLTEDEKKAEETFEDEHDTKLPSRSWWNRLWYGRTTLSTDEDDGGDDYTSMDEAEEGRAAAAIAPPPAVARLPPRSASSDVEMPAYYQGLDEQLSSPTPSKNALSTTKMHRSLLNNLPLPSTKEEQIQQDCSFLYRPVESPEKNKKKRGVRAILDPPPAGMPTMYRHAQDILPPPVMAQYRAKYHQLNQEYAPRDEDEDDRFADYNDYAVTPTVPTDLTLEEQQSHASGSGHHSYVSNVSQSSLFYQHEANGRVVLRLPRDHVRLLVANDQSLLEPGILSVIQTRRPDDDDGTAQVPLEYCLTVSPNLYQRVVSEMTRYHVGDNSVYASEHADIKWAIGIMVIILTILGISTLVYGLN